MLASEWSREKREKEVEVKGFERKAAQISSWSILLIKENVKIWRVGVGEQQGDGGMHWGNIWRWKTDSAPPLWRFQQ